MAPADKTLVLRFRGQDELWKNHWNGMEFHQQLDDGWPESEKDVFQAALRMVVVKDSR